MALLARDKRNICHHALIFWRWKTIGCFDHADMRGNANDGLGWLGWATLSGMGDAQDIDEINYACCATETSGLRNEMASCQRHADLLHSK
jgi:hypothetical protein